MRISGATDLGILVKLVGGDVVNGEDNFDVVLLCLLDETCNILRSIFVEQRVPNLCFR